MPRFSWIRSLAALAVILFLTTLTPPVMADDWPQWRGPERNGKSAETGLLSSWPEGGPPLVYRVSGLGNGYSSLAVVGDHVFTLGDVGEKQYLLAFQRSDGKPAWKAEIGKAWDDRYLGARSTPTVDGDRIYVIGTDGDLVAVETATGKELWRRHLAKDFGGFLMQAQGSIDWRFAESPLVDGDRVIVTPGHADAALVALDKKTGKEIWRAKVPPLGEAGLDGAGYSSVVISNAGGVKQYVQLLGRGVVGVEAETGRFLWGYNRVANAIANIATPLIDGDDVIASTGYETGTALLHVEAKEGGGLAAKEVYFLDAPTMQNHHGGLILHEGYLYTGTGHNKGFPLCVEKATGKVAWGPIRNEGRDSAAIVYADGHLYLRYQNGQMILVEATPEEYRERGSFMIPDVEQFSWSHPVISDGRLYLREQDHLFVYDIRAK